MKRSVTIIILLASIFAAGAQSPAQEVKNHVNDIAKKEPLKSASWGMKAVDGAGNTIVEWSAAKRLVPASNMKLVTTGAALHRLGASHKFETRIGYAGDIDSTGVLHGDIYILGGGDPTLGTTDSIAVRTQYLMRTFTASIKKAGITAVDGYVIGDGRLFSGLLENFSWAYDDLGFAYGAGGNGLSWNANELDITVAAGPAVGDSVRIVSITPDTPWMTFRFNCTTAKKGTGDNLYYFTTDLAPVGELRGTFAIDRKSKVETCSNKFGDLTCAYELCKYMEEAEIPVSEGPARIDRSGRIVDIAFDPVGIALPRDSVTVIGKVQSPELRRIAFETNHRSDNFYAETILKHLGISYTGSAEYDSCYVAERQVLSGLGLGKTGIRIEDGSGLSRKNYITPAWMVAFLRAIQKTKAYEPFLHSLPSPGENGTLKNVLQKEPEAVRKRIFAKSGSMNGILCYSGYILSGDKDPAKTITFSIMTTNSMATTSEMRKVLEGIISRLAAVNA